MEEFTERQKAVRGSLYQPEQIKQGDDKNFILPLQISKQKNQIKAQGQPPQMTTFQKPIKFVDAQFDGYDRRKSDLFDAISERKVNSLYESYVAQGKQLNNSNSIINLDVSAEMPFDLHLNNLDEQNFQNSSIINTTFDSNQTFFEQTDANEDQFLFAQIKIEPQDQRQRWPILTEEEELFILIQIQSGKSSKFTFDECYESTKKDWSQLLGFIEQE